MHKIKENALSSIRIDDLFLFTVFNLLLFQPFLERFSGFAGYIDEIAFLSLLLLTAISARSRKYGQFRRVDKVILVLVVVVALLGIMGNYAAGVQLGLSPILIDVLACFKVPLAFLALLSIVGGETGCRSIERLLSLESVVLLWIMALLALASTFVEFGMSDDEVRYGMHAFHFLYEHPESVNFAAVSLLVMRMTSAPRSKAWIAAFVVAALTLRTKAWCWIAVSLLILFLTTRSGKLKKRYIVLCFFVAVAVAWNQFAAVFSPEASEQARNALLKAAVTIATVFFPFGAGFATFGTAVTATPAYYSPLYYQYDLSNVYGLSPTYPYFVCDSLWPAMLGEFGWIGLLLFFGIMLGMSFAVVVRSKGRSFLAPVLIGVTYLWISSMAESVLFAPSGLLLITALGLCLGFDHDRKEAKCSLA